MSKNVTHPVRPAGAVGLPTGPVGLMVLVGMITLCAASAPTRAGIPVGACCVAGVCQDAAGQGIDLDTCELTLGGIFQGDGSTCATSTCSDVPAVSTWGLAAMLLVILGAGTVILKTPQSLRIMNGNRSNRTNLVGGRGVLSIIVALVLAQGCTVAPIVSSDPQPDLGAIVKVVNDVYLTEGFDRPVLFLDTGEVCDSVLPSCVPPDGGIFPALKTQLETDLQVKVRPLSEADLGDLSVPALTPVLPETGEVGVSVALGRFREQGDGWHVTVTVARSELDGAFIEYVLEPAGDGWTIMEPSPTLEDDIGLDEPGAQFEATIVLLESAIGDLAAISSICENIAQDRSASRCWTKASELNPELREQICDRMLNHVDFPYEEECRLGVVWPLEY